MERKSVQKIQGWQDRIEKEGIAVIRAEVENVHSEEKGYGLAAIKEYEEKQENKRIDKRDEREEKTLDLARKAQDRADKSYQQSWFAIAIAGVAALVTIAIALIGDG